uniref:Uncharacterized protein n=1 Tax=Anopheles maculatus TaxID=74869 RepID=A0A182T459_9DIPT
MLDKSLRNSMLQDVVHFKKQLVRLRRILQETDTLNPFENNNGQFFTTAAAIATANGSIGSGATTTTTTSTTAPAGHQEQQQQQQQLQENVLIRESSVAALALLEDQRQELADLRRQGELTAKDRTIRQQQNLIEKYEAEREKQQHSLSNGGSSSLDSNGDASGTTTGDSNHQSADTISTATQTERLRPVSFGGQEGLGSRSEKPKNGLRTPTAAAVGSPISSSSTTPSHHNTSNGPTTPKSKTQISSVYTQLSSVRHSIAGTSAPTTPTTASHNGGAVPVALRRTSLGSSHNLSSFGLHTNNSGSDRSPSSNSSASNKPVRTTHIGTLTTTSPARQLTNGERISAPKQTKSIPHRTVSTTSSVNGTGGGGQSVSKLNGLNGATKRTTTTGVIRPPSSFGSSNSLVPMEHQQQLKSKSAPVTPLVVTNGKLLTPAATGASECQTNGHHRVADEAVGAESESESDKDTVVNGTLANGLKLIAAATSGGCNDGSNLGNATNSTVNGIVGH